MTLLVWLAIFGAWFVFAALLSVFVIGPMLARNDEHLDLTGGE